MKKILLLASLALTANFYFSQSIISDNFNSLNNGNLGVDITGTTAGQGGWYTVAATAAANSAVSNIQVQDNNATHGKVLSILGSAGTAGTKQVNQNNKLTSVWANRTAGNDILQYELDIYSGATSTSQNAGRFYIWDGTSANKCLIGFALNMTTKQHTLIAYSTPSDINGGTGDVGNWGYTFNAALDADTWYKVGLAWDSVTGEIAYKIVNEATGDIIVDYFFQGAAAGANPTLGNIQVLADSQATPTNAVASTIFFDNVELKATDTIDLLAVNDVASNKANVSVYPNPFTDVLKISDVKGVKSISVNDISGREVKSLAPSAELNLSSLKAGLYIVSLKMEDGSVKAFKTIKK